MIEDIQKRLERITPANGFPVAPSRVVVIDNPEDANELPPRSVAIYQDTDRCCGIFVASSPGAHEAASAVRQLITNALADGYQLTDQGDGLPLLVEFSQTGDTDDGNAIETNPDDCGES